MEITLASPPEVNILTCQIELRLQNIMQYILTFGKLIQAKKINKASKLVGLPYLHIIQHQ